MTPSIVISIDPRHPDYRYLRACCQDPGSTRRAGFAMIEQHTDGTWSLRCGTTTPRPNLSPVNSCLVLMLDENATTSPASSAPDKNT
jgi:hypothetical protein